MMTAPISGADPRGTPMDDETLIRQLVADRSAAMNRGDAQTIVDQYTDDPVVFSLAPPLQQPTEGTRSVANLQAWFDDKGGRVGSELRDLDVSVDGDVAFCHCLERMSAPDDSPGPKFVLWFRSTLGLRRVAGQWRIAHEHSSTPFYMDESMRAAVDLQP
jgi:ketosteroid isomerase-like protein